MCTKFVHKYGCGHQLVETAPCANKRAGACKGVTEKVVPHVEKCDRICGGWYDQAILTGQTGADPARDIIEALSPHNCR